MFLITVAWRNLWRHRRRSLITAAAMGLGMALCMLTIALTDGMYSQITDVMVTQTLGHVQVHQSEFPTEKGVHQTIGDATARTSAVEGLASVTAVTTRVFGSALAGSEDRSAGVRLMGVDPPREHAVSHAADRVDAGRYLAPEAAHEAVLGHALLDELELELGQQVVVIGQTSMGAMASDLFTVVGTVKTGSNGIDRRGLFLHQADLQAFLELPDQVHEVVVTGAGIDQAAPLKDSVEAALTGDDDLLVRTWREADPAAAQLLGMQDVSKVIMLGVVFSVAALGVLNTMLMAVFERTRELGVMRALGLTPSQLLRLVLLESVLLTGVAALCGLALGGLFDWWIITQGIEFATEDGRGLSYQGMTLDPVIKGQFDPMGVVLVLVVMFTISVLASVWPAVRAARLQPVDAMRHV